MLLPPLMALVTSSTARGRPSFSSDSVQFKERTESRTSEEAAAHRRASDVPADEGGVVTRYLPEI
jgi:hypothetical protein